MKLTDLCDDILFKIEDEIKIIKDNKKYKNSYDNFVKKFEYQIDYMKYKWAKYSKLREPNIILCIQYKWIT